MGRGIVAEGGFPQTPQQTDEIDKRYAIWNDIFLDGIDIHERARQRCFYGPVLFVLDLSLLAQDFLSSVWVTKRNPQFWEDGENAADRYFTSIPELQQAYKKTDFDFSIVLRSVGGSLRLKPLLKKIVLDALPHTHLFNQALGALKASARTSGMTNIKIEPRMCVRTCQCQKQYKVMTKSAIEKFVSP